MIEQLRNILKYSGPDSYYIGNKLVYFKQNGKMFKMFPGDRLTMIPVVKPKNISYLHGLWLKYAPEWFKAFKRRKAHMEFLDKQGYRKDSYLRKSFGTQEYIEAEKIRVMRLPSHEEEFNDFDWRQRSSVDRRRSVRIAIREAITEVRTKESKNAKT